MTQNEASQVDRKTSSLMCCSAKLLCNASNLAFLIQSSLFADSSANVWQLSGANPSETGGEGRVCAWSVCRRSHQSEIKGRALTGLERLCSRHDCKGVKLGLCVSDLKIQERMRSQSTKVRRKRQIVPSPLQRRVGQCVTDVVYKREIRR
jgi:hypothetical protein